MTTKTPSRIDQAFARAKAENRKALVIYLTASDPDFETSRRVIGAAIKGGADLIELGIPWSDPSADGLAIQSAMERARKSGGGLSETLRLCALLRADSPAIPIVLFGYANPIAIRGPKVFASDAAKAGADAALCVDWLADTDPTLYQALSAEGLDLIPLLAPTSPMSRIALANTFAGGFFYYVSMTGITGGQLADMQAVANRVGEIRSLTQGRLPIVVGFGISSPSDVREVAGFADGIVVGSAAVRIVESAVAKGEDPAIAMEQYIRSLRASLG